MAISTCGRFIELNSTAALKLELTLLPCFMPQVSAALKGNLYKQDIVFESLWLEKMVVVTKARQTKGGWRLYAFFNKLFHRTQPGHLLSCKEVFSYTSQELWCLHQH